MIIKFVGLCVGFLGLVRLIFVFKEILLEYEVNMLKYIF